MGEAGRGLDPSRVGGIDPRAERRAVEAVRAASREPRRQRRAAGPPPVVTGRLPFERLVRSIGRGHLKVVGA